MIVYQLQIWLHSEPNGGWSASIPLLPGVVSHGDLHWDAILNIKAAFRAAAKGYLKNLGHIPWLPAAGDLPDGDSEYHEVSFQNSFLTCSLNFRAASRAI